MGLALTVNVDRWLNQSVSWEAFSSGDGWEGNTYADAVTIPARKEARVIETAGPGGLEVRQANTIFVTEDVAVGDKIDGEIVQGRDSGTLISGSTVLYRLVTE
jgi:hypothetical protein